MVLPEGFEPSISAVETRCIIQFCYGSRISNYFIQLNLKFCSRNIIFLKDTPLPIGLVGYGRHDRIRTCEPFTVTRLAGERIKPDSATCLQYLEDAVGFQPTDDVTAVACFQDKCNNAILCHASINFNYQRASGAGRMSLPAPSWTLSAVLL